MNTIFNVWPDWDLRTLQETGVHSQGLQPLFEVYPTTVSVHFPLEGGGGQKRKKEMCVLCLDFSAVVRGKMRRKCPRSCCIDGVWLCAGRAVWLPVCMASFKGAHLSSWVFGLQWVKETLSVGRTCLLLSESNKFKSVLLLSLESRRSGEG